LALNLTVPAAQRPGRGCQPAGSEPTP